MPGRFKDFDFIFRSSPEIAGPRSCERILPKVGDRAIRKLNLSETLFPDLEFPFYRFLF